MAASFEPLGGVLKRPGGWCAVVGLFQVTRAVLAVYLMRNNVGGYIYNFSG